MRQTYKMMIYCCFSILKQGRFVHSIDNYVVLLSCARVGVLVIKAV